MNYDAVLADMVAVAREAGALTLRHFAGVILDELLQFLKLAEIARLGELAEGLHVDDADLIGMRRHAAEQLSDHPEHQLRAGGQRGLHLRVHGHG